MGTLAGALGAMVSTVDDGDEAALGKAPADHLALGLDGADVEGFANKIGARHLMNDKDWKGTVWIASLLMKLEPGYVRISFSLDGMHGVEGGVESAVNTGLLRNARQIGGATDLELAFLKDAGVLDQVDFYIGGNLQANPFK